MKVFIFYFVKLLADVYQLYIMFFKKLTDISFQKRFKKGCLKIPRHKNFAPRKGKLTALIMSQWVLNWTKILQYAQVNESWDIIISDTPKFDGFLYDWNQSILLVIYRVVQKVAQLLVGHNFKNACNNSTKLHTTFFQHVFDNFVNFQSKWMANVEMTVALKIIVENSNIIDTSNIGCVWHAFLVWYTAEIKMCRVSMVPNCHHYHLRYNLNRCIAQLSSCSDSNVQQTGLAQKDLTVVVLITMALIATRDFHRVSSKNSYISGHRWSRKSSSHAKGRYFYEFPQKKCVWGLSGKQLRHSLNS